VCLFPNAVVNNDADLWTITRLAPANDELGAMNRMMPARWSMQAESLLSTKPVLLGMPRTKRADLAGTIRPVAGSSGAYRIRVSIVIGCSGGRRRLAGL
jgi:hypothetical protein